MKIDRQYLEEHRQEIKPELYEILINAMNGSLIGAYVEPRMTRQELWQHHTSLSKVNVDELPTLNERLEHILELTIVESLIDLSIRRELE